MTFGTHPVYRVLVGRPKTKGPLVRPRHRWESNIKMDLQYVGCGMNWINVAEKETGGELL